MLTYFCAWRGFYFNWSGGIIPSARNASGRACTYARIGGLHSARGFQENAANVNRQDVSDRLPGQVDTEEKYASNRCVR